MGCTRRDFVGMVSAAALCGLASCAQDTPAPEEQTSEDGDKQVEEEKVDLKEFKALEFDMAAWEYDEENDVYYQLGIPYCLNPASSSYESLAIFVPGPYLIENKEGKKSELMVDEQAKVGEFTPLTAPVVMPINSGTLGPQACPTSYSYAGLGTYLSAGCVYVYAGFRGRSSGYDSSGEGMYPGGDPWPVVDLKAAVRYLRYNAAVLPGDMSRVITFGFSAGGGVSALMGCTGDSELYVPYLEEIGAATHDGEGKTLSDATFGSATWCPVTSFDTADAAYEWMMGQYFSEGTRAEGTWTKVFSNDLACAYAAYVNDMDLRDEDGQPLVLDETSGELFADGSYYTHMVTCIENAATQFFSSTQFPYTYTPHHQVNGNFPGDPNLQSAGTGAPDVEAVTGDASAQAAGVSTGETASEGKTNVQSVVYNSDVDYVNDLNGDSVWLTYNQRYATVRISSLGNFVRRLKVAAKDVGAFDSPNRSTVENQLFGTEEVGSLHFSKMMSDQLGAARDSYAVGDGWDDAYVQDWAGDLSEVDALEVDMTTRMNMFNPLYFLSGHYEGFGTANVAPHWRINSGLFQTDTSLCTELNLALVLQHYEGVSNVAFTPVWGKGHTLAEVSGSAEENLIAWIRGCCAE